MPTKATITRATKALYGRLYPEEVTADEPEASPGTQQAAPANVAGELSEFLRSSHGTNRPETDTFTKEFNLHVSGGRENPNSSTDILSPLGSSHRPQLRRSVFFPLQDCTLRRYDAE